MFFCIFLGGPWLLVASVASLEKLKKTMETNPETSGKIEQCEWEILATKCSKWEILAAKTKEWSLDDQKNEKMPT